jgi:ATP-dependent DNA helicase RecG
MKYEDVLDLIKTQEGYTIEFKKSIDSSLGKEMCAFANAQGGKIILGVDDKGTIIGLKLTNHNISKIQDIARNMNPSFSVNVEQIKDLGIIYIPEGKNKPYTVNGHFYLRQGANSQQLNRDEIRSLFQKENLISFEIQIKNFQTKDFSNDAFSKF